MQTLRRTASLLLFSLWASLLMATPYAQTTENSGFMWEARRGSARVLLIGTVHVGRLGQSDLSPEQITWINEAQIIAFEADVFNAQRTLAATQRYALFSSGSPGLDQRLSAPLRLRLEKVLQRYGYSLSSVSRFKAWALANHLVMLEAQRLGFTPAASTEAQLYAIAQANKKNIVEIESVERQLALFDSAPEAVQLAYLEQAIVSIENGAGEREIRSLLGGWSTRDISSMLERVAQMKNSSNIAERWMSEEVIDARHPLMVTTIERFAESGKLHLVAVGTLHYFGDNGLLKLLKARGFTITSL